MRGARGRRPNLFSKRPSCMFAVARRRLRHRALAALLFSASGAAFAGGPDKAILDLTQAQQPAFIETLRDLVSIESGSGDREGLDRISDYIAERLRRLGGKVDFIEAPAKVDADVALPAKFGRMVQAIFEGSGSKSILLIAHMDTVYLRGMLDKQPFRIDGNRAYGLGISDDKAGVAVILHTLEVLKASNFREYGKITVLINGDEEIGSPASRATLQKLGAAHDLTMSHEGTAINNEALGLATAGLAAVNLSVTGRASHAGSAPERGRNAVMELAHQILQMRDFSDPARGIKMNWTMISGGTNRNVIPAEASAKADVRVRDVGDYDALERKLRATIKNQLIPDTQVSLSFAPGRPPLVPSAAAKSVANYATTIYAELGKTLKVSTAVGGGGTDAAYAALKTSNPVIERFGMPGYGAHSDAEEYVLIDAIPARLYLTTRLIIDFSKKLVN